MLLTVRNPKFTMIGMTINYELEGLLKKPVFVGKCVVS